MSIYLLVDPSGRFTQPAYPSHQAATDACAARNQGLSQNVHEINGNYWRVRSCAMDAESAPSDEVSHA